jgi:hypothetical protein
MRELRNLDLNLLSTLDTLLRERNVSASARTLGISQSAMSHRLSRLRETFEDPLLVDIELQPAYALPVFVRTSDDKRLATELAKLHIWQGMNIVATKEPLLGHLPPTEHSSVGDIGVGRLRGGNDMRQRTDPDAGDGVLELDDPPPVHAALLIRHLLIAQQRVDPGQQELRFTVDLDDIRQHLAKVRLRVLHGGRPVAKARVELSTAQGGGSHQVTDDNGIASLENVMPGLAYFGIGAKDVEQFASHVTIAAGADVDLGDVVLTQRTELLGRVVGADGTPVPASLQWTAIDLWRPPHPLLGRRGATADGDGHFQLFGTGQRRYSVAARSQDGRVGFAIVDAAVPRDERVVVTVHPTAKLQTASRDPLQLRAVVVADELGNPLVVQRLEPRWPRGTISLPAGDYQLFVYDGQGRQLLHEPLRMTGTNVDKELP